MKNKLKKRSNFLVKKTLIIGERRMRPELLNRREWPPVSHNMAKNI